MGGKLGRGSQWMSGVHVDDVAGIVLWALESETVRGPVNAVMPMAFRNVDFTRELSRCVRRPAIFPVPAFALRLGFGELSRFMLGNWRVAPRVRWKVVISIDLPRSVRLWPMPSVVLLNKLLPD